MIGVIYILFLLVLLLITGVVYLFAGLALLLPTFTKSAYLAECRKAALKLTSALTISDFILKITFYLIDKGSGLSILSSYPLPNVLNMIDRNLPKIIKETWKSSNSFLETFIFRLFESAFLWGLYLIVIFIIISIIPPLKRLLSKEEVALWKVLLILLPVITIISFLSFGFSRLVG